jgi:divalent metal cation (Fe/Co/Zn/Cd) transporter
MLHPEMPRVELPVLPLAPPAVAGTEQLRLVRRAKLLAWTGIAWHAFEAAVAIVAGLAAGSIALVGFGADSLIEAFSGFAVVWRFAASRAASDGAERRAQQLVSVSFYVLALYVAVEALRSLAGGEHPEASWAGIGLSVVTLAAMPPLAAAKARVGERLGSAATRSEGRQNLLCAYLSGALLVGLGANALLGWWWADPVTGLLIAAVAVKEGRDAWRGEACCTAAPIPGSVCADDCCR